MMFLGLTPGIAAAGCSDGAASGVNWNGCSFPFASLSDTNLGGASLVGADLSYAVLFRSNLAGADLSNANFKDSFPVAANMTSVRATGANFIDADLVGADLTNADFRNANFEGADLDFADVSGANFAGANLTGADFIKASGVTTAIFGMAPVGVDDLTVAREGGRVFIPLLANDDPADSNPGAVARVSLATAPSHGTFDARTGFYTPRPGFIGTDSFTYRPIDKIQAENLPSGAKTEYAGSVATVTIRVVRTVRFTGAYAGASGQEGEIARLYAAALNRQPDAEGFAFWLGQYRSGVRLDSIAGGFLASSEFLGDTSGLSNAQFVTLIYHNVFGRNPDTSGFNFWVGELDGGLSRAKLLVLFANGAEFKQLTGSS